MRAHDIPPSWWSPSPTTAPVGGGHAGGMNRPILLVSAWFALVGLGACSNAGGQAPSSPATSEPTAEAASSAAEIATPLTEPSSSAVPTATVPSDVASPNAVSPDPVSSNPVSSDAVSSNPVMSDAASSNPALSSPASSNSASSSAASASTARSGSGSAAAGRGSAIDAQTTAWFTTLCTGLAPLNSLSSLLPSAGGGIPDTGSFGTRITGIGMELKSTSFALKTQPPPTFPGGAAYAAKATGALTQLGAAFSDAGPKIGRGNLFALAQLAGTANSAPVHDLQSLTVDPATAAAITAIPACRKAGFSPN